MRPCYTIYDLSDATGTSVRSIQNYIAKGLIPPAHKPSQERGVSWGTRYSSIHLDALIAVVELKEGNLSLADIRDRLNPYTGEDDDE